MDFWSIGEQEAALDLVVSDLLSQGIPIREDVRAQLAVTSETWGQREALEDRISQCRSSSDDDLGVRLLAPADAVTQAGTTLSGQPELADLLVVPWITCLRCEQVLGRAHKRESWGDLSFHYVLFRPGTRTQTRVFNPTAAQDALTVLASCPSGEPPAHLP
jgi:hypothetical protein